MEAVVPLAGAIGVRHCSYSVRRVCAAVQCQGGQVVVTRQWPSIRIGVGGW